MQYQFTINCYFQIIQLLFFVLWSGHTIAGTKDIICEEQWYEENNLYPGVNSPKFIDEGWAEKRNELAQKLAELKKNSYTQEDYSLLKQGTHPEVMRESGIEDELEYLQRFAAVFIGKAKRIEYVSDAYVSWLDTGAFIVVILKEEIHWSTYREVLPQYWRGIEVYVGTNPNAYKLFSL